MESKKDKAVRLLKKRNNLLCCPVCQSNLETNNQYSLICNNGHNFDISKKGVVNLWGKGNDKVYNDSLFQNRRIIMTEEYYSPVLDSIINIISQYKNDDEPLTILDAGCGEGSLTTQVAGAYKNPLTSTVFVGMDLSKSGINMATDSKEDILWIINDIARMDVNNGVFNVILNILSPANYSEFKRVLTKDGIVIKVIPGKNYLRELRSGEYDNSTTMDHTINGLTVLDRIRNEYTLSVNTETFKTFASMTPLTYKKDIQIPNKKAYELTIDLEIIVGKIR